MPATREGMATGLPAEVAGCCRQSRIKIYGKEERKQVSV